MTAITQLLAQWSAPQLRDLLAEDTRLTADIVSALAREGLPQAQVCYGRMLLAGTGLLLEAAAALSWFQRAADTGDLDAINMVGPCLDNGLGNGRGRRRSPLCTINSLPNPGTLGRSTTLDISTWMDAGSRATSGARRALPARCRAAA